MGHEVDCDDPVLDRLLARLDLRAVSDAALRGDGDMDEQADLAQEEIKRQLPTLGYEQKAGGMAP